MINFPEVPRVRYNKNPLVEVICQLRFPRILKLDTQPPAEFQEAIASSYSIVNVSRSLDVSVPTNAPASQPVFRTSKSPSYEFLTRDKRWKLVLTPDFIALSTLAYERWEEFYDKLKEAIEWLTHFYKLTIFTRIGLRYQDVIMRSDLELTDKKWNELLNPTLCGVLAAPEFNEQDLLEVFSTFSCNILEDAMVRVRHGLAKQDKRDEIGYLIDADFFLNDVEISETLARLNGFNSQARYLFRWCITPTLHAAMEPYEISNNENFS
jgi:uncharacterized protein (TIGR04255 family)